jgi:hypothetical protein
MRYPCKLSGISILVGVGIVAFAFVLMAQPASAEDVKSDTPTIAAPEPTAAPLPPVKKTTRSAYKPYFIEFRARSAASYGHMYVLYGQVNGRNEIIKSNIAGLHPAGDRNDCENCSVIPWTLGHLIPVPSETGASDGDLEEKYVAARYRVMVDAAEYKRVSAYIDKLKADNPQWHALWNNCVGFGRNVAEFMNLKTPTFIWVEPKDFVEGLRELNGGPKQGPLKDAPSGASASASSPTNAATTPTAAPAATPAANPATPPAPQKPKKQPVASSSATGAKSGTPN